MIVYRDKYTIPTWNWLMIQEKGFDLSYLFKKQRPVKKREYKKLYEIYMNILYTLDDINISLLAKYTDWQALLTQHRAEYIRFKANQIIKKDYDYVVSELEKVFREYLNELQKYYNQFEVKEYYFNKDYKKLYTDLFKETAAFKYLKDLKPFKDIKFYVWDEYFLFIQKHPKLLALTNHENFKQIFIKERTIKIDDLVKLDTYLSDIYSGAGLYNDYQFQRSKLFDINILQSERKHEHSAFDEVSAISQILKRNIDLKEPLAKYESDKKAAKVIVKAQQDKKLNKPRASGRV